MARARFNSRYQQFIKEIGFQYIGEGGNINGLDATEIIRELAATKAMYEDMEMANMKMRTERDVARLERDNFKSLCGIYEATFAGEAG